MKLTAYLNGVRVGWFEQVASGRIVLEYDRAWQERRTLVELSVSLPKSRRRHDSVAAENYLWNLLPDNLEVLERWARTFGVSPRNPLALLAHVGADAAGAVQLFDSDQHDEAELSVVDGLDVIGEAGVADHLRQLRADPAAWVSPGQHSGYFSLAGAQSKFTLADTPHGWAIPTGRTASTHIVKPGVRGLASSDVSEHLTMRAAHLLGIQVAESRLMQFEDQSAIVVTRFDRARLVDDLHAGRVVRLHQEDLAQASGVHPSMKYQNEGGPGIAGIGELMRSVLGRHADQDIGRFFEATLFNWAALATDAHAKNYALLSTTGIGRPRLAPLYDLGSMLGYVSHDDRRAKLAMSYDGHYRAFEIEPRHIVTEAKKLNLDEGAVVDRARELAGGVADALRQAVTEVTDSLVASVEWRAFMTRLVEQAHARSALLVKQLR